ncbi:MULTISPECIES: type II toxin-antitoxin system HicB family antitoxin [unclassified Campylobacter]|uniref:type II toxin-antitoxin system HicB family antitoxin n=1 Tax=unclassified Campylobacter TaxID=2593542 RepID=UPI003D33000B
MKDLSYYLALPYEILVRPLSPEEGGGYLARYKNYPLVMGDGESEAEAIADVKKAFEFVIASDLAEGKAIQEPTSQTSKVRVNVSLSRQILDAIDKVSKNRSAFLEDAAKMALG